MTRNLALESAFILPEPEISRLDVAREWKAGYLTFAELTEKFETWSAHDVGLYFTRGIEGLVSLASKRGNRVYTYRLRSKIELLGEVMEPHLRLSHGHTNAIFITLTDPNMRPYREAWSDIGDRWNLFLANLRKNHRILFVRSWESTVRGYPHVHALIIFEDRDFKTFLKWSDKRRSMVCRIEGKHEFEKYWRGHIDVEGVESSKGVVWYLAKEIFKAPADLTTFKRGMGRQTMAILWAEGKRSYSMSQTFSRELTDIMKIPYASDAERSEALKASVQEGERSEPDRLDTNPPVSLTQTQPEKWTFAGVCSWREAVRARAPGQKEGRWSYLLTGPPVDLRECGRRKKEPGAANEQEHALIARGARVGGAKVGTLESWQEGYEDVYDELTVKARARMTRMWRELN